MLAGQMSCFLGLKKFQCCAHLGVQGSDADRGKVQVVACMLVVVCQNCRLEVVYSRHLNSW